MGRAALNFDPESKPKREPCPCGSGKRRSECAKKHVRETALFRTNLTAEPRTHRFAAADMESKRRGTDLAGFDDVFMVGMDDGASQHVFRNDPKRVGKLPVSERAYAPGGCIRLYLEHVLTPRYGYGTKKGQGGFVHVFHNGGRFDLNHLLMALMRMRSDFKIEVVVNGDKVIAILVRLKKGETTYTWKFWDSSLPVSLKSLGEIISGGSKDAQKLKHDLDMPASDSRWGEYCLQDCRVLRLAMELFQGTVNELGGQWKPTLPGTVMDLFRRRISHAVEDGISIKIRRNRHFLSCSDVCKKCWNVQCKPHCPLKPVRDEEIAYWKWDPVLQTHIGSCEWAPDGCAHFFFRRSFFGGRTEMFAQNYLHPDWISCGETVKQKPKHLRKNAPYDFRIFDITSSYPASMRSPMPVGRMHAYEGRKFFDRIWGRYLAGIEKRGGFIECTVEVPQNLPYPPLPVRSDGKVKFPTGYLQGVWTTIELKQAVKLGVKIRAVNRHVWIGMRPVFRATINSLWEIRKQAIALDKIDKAAGHKARSEIIKLLYNSMFGKTGMGEYRDEFLISDDDEALPEGAKAIDGGPYGRRTKHVDVDYIMPAVASWITSESRLRLYALFLQVLSLGGRVWYGDTDSVHTNRELPVSSELGGLKREYDENQIVRCRYDTAKVYQIDMIGPCPKDCAHRPDRDTPCKRDVHSVVKSKGIQEPTPDKLERLRMGEKLKQRSVPKFRKLITGNFKTFETKYDATKSMTMKYDKRSLNQETGQTKALRFELDDVVHEKRAKTTPNLKKWDAAMLSVREREAQWRRQQ